MDFEQVVFRCQARRRNALLLNDKSGAPGANREAARVLPSINRKRLEGGSKFRGRRTPGGKNHGSDRELDPVRLGASADRGEDSTRGRPSGPVRGIRAPEREGGCA